MIRVSVPSFRKVEDEHEKSYTVYTIEVWVSGKYHSVERRYTEFEELHKQIKKSIPTPEFPPKKMLKWNPKVLEQRRQGLQLYLQGVSKGGLDGYIPNVLLWFLKVKTNVHSFESSDLEPTHQPMLEYEEGAFLADNHKSSLPDIILEGVHTGMY